MVHTANPLINPIAHDLVRCITVFNIYIYILLMFSVPALVIVVVVMLVWFYAYQHIFIAVLDIFSLSFFDL